MQKQAKLVMLHTTQPLHEELMTINGNPKF